MGRDRIFQAARGDTRRIGYPLLPRATLEAVGGGALLRPTGDGIVLCWCLGAPSRKALLSLITSSTIRARLKVFQPSQHGRRVQRGLEWADRGRLQACGASKRLVVVRACWSWCYPEPELPVEWP